MCTEGCGSAVGLSELSGPSNLRNSAGSEPCVKGQGSRRALQGLALSRVFCV